MGCGCQNNQAPKPQQPQAVRHTVVRTALSIVKPPKLTGKIFL